MVGKTSKLVAVVALLVAAASTGCKADDPEWCESNVECVLKKNGNTMCDIVGRFGPANTCIRPVGGSDASDTGPQDHPRLDLRLDATPVDGDDAPQDLADTDAGTDGAGDGGDA